MDQWNDLDVFWVAPMLLYNWNEDFTAATVSRSVQNGLDALEARLLAETQMYVPSVAPLANPTKLNSDQLTDSNSASDAFSSSSTQLAIAIGTAPCQFVCPREALPVPIEMLELIEQLTGWVVEFEESRTSIKQRQLPTLKPKSASGTFSVIDMSTDWPAGRPTAHRGKCDRFMELFSELVGELQTFKSQLVEAQSTIAAYCPLDVDDEAEIIDSFIPRYDVATMGERRNSDRRSAENKNQNLDEPDSDFEIVQPRPAKGLT